LSAFYLYKLGKDNSKLFAMAGFFAEQKAKERFLNNISSFDLIKKGRRFSRLPFFLIYGITIPQNALKFKPCTGVQVPL